MRDYGIVHSTFWTSETTHGLSDDGKLLALYLLTGPHTTALGCFRLPDGYVMEDLQWSVERVRKGFSELLAKGFADRCETTKWVLIRTYLKWNPPDNPNQRKSLRRLAEQIPDQACIKSAIEALINQHCGPAQQLTLIDEGKANLPNGSGTVAKPLLNQEQEQEQEQEQIQKQKHIESCAERLDAQPPSAVLFQLPLLNNKKPHDVRESDVAKWSLQYPAVNVRVEVGKMAGWLEANERNRKTHRGILPFIHRWLSRAQDDAPKVAGTNGKSGGNVISASERMRRKREPVV